MTTKTRYLNITSKLILHSVPAFFVAVILEPGLVISSQSEDIARFDSKGTKENHLVSEDEIKRRKGLPVVSLHQHSEGDL